MHSKHSADFQFKDHLQSLNIKYQNDDIGPPSPFDRELAKPLKNILKEILVPLTAELIPRSRDLTEKNSLSDEEIRRHGAFSFEEHIVPGPEGEPDISLIICRPTATSGPYPVIYNIHGGGMVAGNNRTAELMGELKRAEELQLAVVAVNYRLAPEHPYPAPVEDCYAGLHWLANNAADWNIDPNQIIISGNSAGGGLAAAVALLARERGGPYLIGQMLQCPMLDDRCDTISAKQMQGVGLWDTISNLTGWTALLGPQRGGEDVPSFAAPARATNLSQLPPTFIDVGAIESLRDEAISYASRIWQHGGEAELHVWSGAFHSFDQWVPDAIVSQSADEVRIAWMRRLLNSD